MDSRLHGNDPFRLLGNEMAAEPSVKRAVETKNDIQFYDLAGGTNGGLTPVAAAFSSAVVWLNTCAL